MNGVKITPYWIKATMIDADDVEAQYIYYFDTFESLMREACRMYAFDDCEPRQVDEVMANGHRLQYCGWEPGMRMRFIDLETWDVVWEECYPEWDH